MAKVAELIRLSKLFHSNDLEFIPLKGPLLSWRLHRDVTVRYSTDLDIQVNQAELDRCIELIKMDGYRLNGKIPAAMELPRTKNKKRLVLDLTYHKVFSNPERKMRLEMHWNLISYPIISKQRLDLLIGQNREKFMFHKEQFTVFSKEMDFVYLMIHGALHHWFRLKWLHDIYAYSKDEELDWDKIMDISSQFNAIHLVSQALQLVDIYWTLPDRLKPMLVDNKRKMHPILLSYPVRTIADPDIKPEIVNWRVKDIYDLTRYTLLLFPGAIIKTRFLKGMLFNEGDLYILKLPDYLSFLYFFLRPVLLIYSKYSGEKQKVNLQDD
ncbi:MAG: nucleotidyltransferase family protein [Bacteroidia bacterium]|nr:nucleotidyltransferase family protein [Bacteroidia bacterium]